MIAFIAPAIAEQVLTQPAVVASVAQQPAPPNPLIVATPGAASVPAANAPAAVAQVPPTTPMLAGLFGGIGWEPLAAGVVLILIGAFHHR